VHEALVIGSTDAIEFAGLESLHDVDNRPPVEHAVTGCGAALSALDHKHHAFTIELGMQVILTSQFNHLRPFRFACSWAFWVADITTRASSSTRMGTSSSSHTGTPIHRASNQSIA